MRIQSQPQINYRQQYLPKFTANQRNVTDKAGKLLYRNNTWFFRADLNWEKFTDSLIQKYKGIDKVNIHCYACSEGAEPFSLAMLLIKKLGEKGAKKFFPIIASDIDREILAQPQKGILHLSEIDVKRIKSIGPEYKNFVEFDENYKYSQKYSDMVCNGKIKPILKNAVVFKNYDIRDTISNIPKENTVLMARNFWPYLPDKKSQSKLAKDIANQLGNNSMIVFGDFDWQGRTSDLLIRSGFRESGIDYCLDRHIAKEQKALTCPEFLQATFIKK